MQEVFKNIIEKLEKKVETAKRIMVPEIHDELDRIANETAESFIEAYKESIEIVKQEAEKFGADTNVGSNGWISCSDRLPEEEGKYITTSRIYYVPDHVDEPDNFIGLKISYYSKKSGWHDEEVIAWMPLPELFHPKGE